MFTAFVEARHATENTVRIRKGSKKTDTKRILYNR